MWPQAIASQVLKHAYTHRGCHVFWRLVTHWYVLHSKQAAVNRNGTLQLVALEGFLFMLRNKNYLPVRYESILGPLNRSICVHIPTEIILITHYNLLRSQEDVKAIDLLPGLLGEQLLDIENYAYVLDSSLPEHRRWLVRFFRWKLLPKELRSKGFLYKWLLSLPLPDHSIWGGMNTLSNSFNWRM